MREKEFGVIEDQRIFYEENGYLIIPDLFSKEECKQALLIFRSHADQTFRALMNIEREAPEIKRFIKNPRLVAAVESLHNWADMGWIGSQVLFKELGSPFVMHAWNPHQDNVYIEAPYGTYVSAIISLADSDPENGGMYVYPGSHREVLLPHEPRESFNPDVNPGHLVQVPEYYECKDLYLSQGMLYIQHGNLIHGSYANTSENRSRPHFGIMCIVKGVSFNPGKNFPRQFTSFHEEG